MHAGNRFMLRVKAIDGDHGQLEARLSLLAERGVPNYFGEQRFGHEAGNLQQALAMFGGQLQVRDRTRRGLYLSAARSWLFNQVLAERIRRSCWDQAIEGDVMVYDDGQTTFQAFMISDDIVDKLRQMRIHPTGPLWGAGMSMARKHCARLESDVLSGYGDWCRGLEKAGLRQDRRSLRLAVDELDWKLSGDRLELSFELATGGFATSVLRECVDYR
jgi:tRNA pseudouridine13 synthase